MSATQDRIEGPSLALDNKPAVTRGPRSGESAKSGKALSAERRSDGSVVTLEDKWTVTRGPVVITGMQAIARMLLAQSELDRSRGLKTGGYVSGYRGSPVGNLDTALWAIRDRLKAAGIVFQPGVNEDLAATAVRGTQQLGLLPNPNVDGVFAAWYGKGPGVDRSSDALKHGNYAGTSPTGGVLCLYGDDHAGKSSTVAHQSEQAMAACLIPSLYPATAAEIVTFGLYGYALSRYCGLWVGLKLVNETAEQTMTADLALDDFEAVIPSDAPEGVHIRSGAMSPLAEEQVAVEKRLPLVHKFVRANGLNRTVFRAPQPRLGIVAAGKSYGDVRQGLALLGLDEDRAAQLGISLYKVGCTWPLEPEGLAAFAEGHATLLFVEEKKSFLEAQAAAILINREERPRLLGKNDEAGEALFSMVKLLEPIEIALAIAGRLTQLGVLDARLQTCAEALASDTSASQLSTTTIQQSNPSSEIVGTPKRVPYFCSGCPHNRSTRIPDGSLSMSGIGCHGMINFVRPEEALPPVHMGAEGGNWVGIAPFSGTKHIFQNMGDGTYYHSGLLAIRAAIAAKVNITYKILYNDAVAMTGGQPVDGPISVADIARQVRDEGVKTIVLVSDDPARHKNTSLPSNIDIFHRDRLDEVQRRLRATEGTSVLIYEQTCAAEKRRRRKRGKFPDPPKRLFIAKGVCEGCGDCSVQSTCVSLEPVETAFGLKRRIDQSSCNKDYSCLNGFCPSFITVRNAEPRKPAPSEIDESVFEKLSDPVVANRPDGTENIILAGVGGMGVVTVAALIGMAAHLEGKAASLFDMTGLAQKNGAVYSHVRVGRTADAIATQRIGRGEATSLIAFDLVAALADESASTLAVGKTRAMLNADVGSTVDFQFSRDFKIAPNLMEARLGQRVDRERMMSVNASSISATLMGDSIAATLVLLGAASQNGLLPVGPASLEAAIRLNGVAVPMNLRAFRLGRLYVQDRAQIEAMVGRSRPDAPIVPKTLDELVEVHSARLVAYQSELLASRYRALVAKVASAEQAVVPGSQALATAVARGYGRLLAYKDEYEVARLLSDPAIANEIKSTFQGGATLSFNLAPPLLAGKPVNGRPQKREISVAFMLPVLRMLSRLKRLRGTPFDVFGYMAERRMERALIPEYEALTERALKQLTPENHQRLVGLLALADDVRGFGPVKKAAVDAYHAKLKQMEAAISSSASSQQTAA